MKNILNKSFAVKVIIPICLVTMTNFIGFSQTYSIVGTGQTNSYNTTVAITMPTSGQAFYGQNSNYPGNMRSYTNNGNGTVTDNVTGLMWQQTEDQNGDGSINFYDKLTYSEALAGAATCNTGGYNDWRLPTIKELYSLAMFYGAEPGPTQPIPIKYIDTTYFSVGCGDVNSLSHGSLGTERIIDGQIVSSTLYVSQTMGVLETVFGFNFIDGRIKGYPTTYTVPECGTAKHYYVLYVRGNAAYGTNQFVNNGNGTITDNATGLMWMQNDNGAGLTWENALSYAENLSYAGYSDWRLPDTKELQSIIDYTRSPATTSSAAINPLFNCTQITNEGGIADYQWYWSNTTFSSQSQTNGASATYFCFGRAMGYFPGIGWTDIHGAGCQRSDPKPNSFVGYTQNGNGYYNANAPQGDAVRISNYVRLVRNTVPASINENGNPDLFNVYPNPVSDQLTIEMNGSNEKITIEIFNSIGQSVFSSNLNGKLVVETSGFSSGVYLIKFISNKTVEFKKILVK
ncbi:MAG: DUF1566 domain-containing protein [Bacteroidetes bacterium]|nr:DUF1566 domain-containing protein [Bacteroidota bacterium]